ncbi:MAG: carbon monoxide dehydrogenase [Firmicutes bacterium]|nr:carbon monoxide dehydrogenase [Dethiobacter sp.]MBS3889433.1 carbon monoxide dehydrogenase [Bacillota bacterium]
MGVEKERNKYLDLLSPVPVLELSHPEKGKALLNEKIVPEQEALREVARTLLLAKNPVIFAPGRILLWGWGEGSYEKAEALKVLAAEVGAEILPVMDVRPEYPKMRTATEINPYHVDLVIGHNKYDVAVFMGVECSYADVALKIIRDGTECYTVALCGHLGHVDASATFCHMGRDQIAELAAVVAEVKQELQAGQGVGKKHHGNLAEGNV